LWRERFLPAAVRGPVDCAQGCQLRIAAACRARRSGVQPFDPLVRLSIFLGISGFSSFFISSVRRPFISGPA
jgi:hypothetical protein